MARDDLARVVLEADVRGGLTRRTVLASAVLALLVGAVFVVLIRAVTKERDSADQAIRSQEVIAAANRLERLVLDLETGQRGFAITGNERFLEPWLAAREAYPSLADALETATGGGLNGQAEAARRITAAIDAYIAQYSVPLVEAARRGETLGAERAALDEGKRRVDELRARVRRVRRRRASAVHHSRGGRRRRCTTGAHPGGGRSRRVDPAHRAVRHVPDAGGRAARAAGGHDGRPARRRRPVDAHARDRGGGGRRPRALAQHDGGVPRAQPRRAAPDRGGAGRAPARRHAGGARRAARGAVRSRPGGVADRDRRGRYGAAALRGGRHRGVPRRQRRRRRRHSPRERASRSRMRPCRRGCCVRAGRSASTTTRTP